MGGTRLLERLRGVEAMDGVGHVRGLGLMAAVEVVADKTTKALFPAQAGLDAEAHGRVARARALHARRVGLHLPGTAARDQRCAPRPHRRYPAGGNSAGAGRRQEGFACFSKLVMLAV